MTQESTPGATLASKFVSDDDIYRHTSQYRLWSMTPAELEKKRRQTHERAVATTRKRLDDSDIPRNMVDALTYEEEQQLIMTAASKIPSLTDALNLPTQVKATATSYFRKFYIVHSAMEYKPKNILFTCVFLAAKAENKLVTIEKFCSHLSKVQPSNVLDNEFLVLKSLSFALMVMNGYRPLRGIFLDIQAVLPNLSYSDLSSLRDKAKEIIIQSFFSDAEFHFTPPQITLAALLIVREDIMMEYLQNKFGDDGLSHLRKSSKVIDSKGIDKLSTLLSVLNECKELMLTAPSQVSPSEAKALERKLHYCHNPEKMLAAKRKLEQRNEDNGNGSMGTPPLDDDELPSKRQKIE